MNGSSDSPRFRSRPITRPYSPLRSPAAFLAYGAVAGAPLALGGVHRFPMLILIGVAAASVMMLGISYAGKRGGRLRVGLPVLLPLIFVLIPALQSVPLPAALRTRIDPEGSALLENGPGDSARRPLSLDAISTRIELGKAAAAA